MYIKEYRHAHYSYISKVSSFSPIYGPSPDIYTRTDERNHTVIYITLEKEICSFTYMYRTGKNALD